MTGFDRTPEQVKEMFYGQNTIFKRLYRDIKGKYADGENALVEALTGTIKEKIDFLSVNNVRNNSVTATDDIVNSWREMLISDNPVVRDFAKDLITYTYYSSGFRTNMNSFFEYIPHQELKKLVEGSIASFQETFQNDGVAVLNFVDKFFRNNWSNTKIVPNLKSNEQGIFNKSIKMPQGKGYIMLEVTNKNKHRHDKPYVLITRRSINPVTGMETSNNALYKKYATSADGDINYFIPVPKLGTYAQGNYIYEYNSSIPVDGESAIKANNLTKNGKQALLEINNKAKQELDALIETGELVLSDEIEKKAKNINMVDINNNNESKNLQKGKDDGLFKCGDNI